MKHLVIALCAMLASCLPHNPALAEPVFPDRGRAAVVDAAAVIPDNAEAALNARIVGWVHKTGHQLAVVTVPSLQGYDIKDYGYRLGRAWGLGSKGGNDGVILLLAPKERKVRIDVGYGLEPVLTDGLTSRIIRDRIVPQLKAGETAGAMSDGADAIMAAATPHAPAAVPTSAPAEHSSSWPWVLAGIVFGMIVSGLLWMRVRARIREHHARNLRRYEARRQPDTSRSYTARSKAPDARAAPSAPAQSPSTARSAPHISPAPSPAPTPSRRDDDFSSSAISFGAGYGLGSSSSSSDSGSSWGGSDSSSSSGYDSGGGSFGGGGSDSSY